MSNYEVREKRLDPKAADYIQRWLDEYAKREPVRFVADEPDEPGDALGVWRWIVPALAVSVIGLLGWAFA